MVDNYQDKLAYGQQVQAQLTAEQEQQKQERLKQQSQPATFSTPFMSRM